MGALTIAKFVGIGLIALAVISGLWWVYSKVELSYTQEATIAADNNAINDLKAQVETAVGIANNNEQKYEAEVQAKTAAEAIMQKANQQANQLATDNETLKEKVHDTKSTCVDPKLNAFIDSMRVRGANRNAAAGKRGTKPVVSNRPVAVPVTNAASATSH